MSLPPPRQCLCSRSPTNLPSPPPGKTNGLNVRHETTGTCGQQISAELMFLEFMHVARCPGRGIGRTLSQTRFGGPLDGRFFLKKKFAPDVLRSRQMFFISGPGPQSPKRSKRNPELLTLIPQTPTKKLKFHRRNKKKKKQRSKKCRNHPSGCKDNNGVFSHMHIRGMNALSSDAVTPHRRNHGGLLNVKQVGISAGTLAKKRLLPFKTKLGNECPCDKSEMILLI